MLETTDGISLAVGGSAVGAIATCLVNIWRARNQRTRIDPQPLSVEQSQFQALCKDNSHDHSDIFERLRKVEADVAGHTAAIISMKDMLNKIYDMVTKLYLKEQP